MESLTGGELGLCRQVVATAVSRTFTPPIAPLQQKNSHALFSLFSEIPSWTKIYMHDGNFLELTTVNNTCELHVEIYLKLSFMAPTCVSFPNM